MISVSVAKTRSSRRAAGLWLEAQVDNYICVFVYVLVLWKWMCVCIYFMCVDILFHYYIFRKIINRCADQMVKNLFYSKKDYVFYNFFIYLNSQFYSKGKIGFFLS